MDLFMFTLKYDALLSSTKCAYYIVYHLQNAVTTLLITPNYSELSDRPLPSAGASGRHVIDK